MSGYNPFFPERDLHHEGDPRVRFSPTEAMHLLLAVVVLSYAFAILLDGSTGFDLVPSLKAAVAAVAAVASGFVLHELAHKVVAQRYGHWAEFRAHFVGLGISFLLAVVPPHILLAAPGAVLIQGRVTPKENGLISLAGPATNFVIALACLPFFVFAVDDTAWAPRIFATVTGVNSLLALFNLVPLDPFDGRKVWRWNKGVYLAALFLSLAMFAFALIQNAFP